MAALDEAVDANGQSLDPVIKRTISAAFWAFFYNNKNYKISVRVWFVNVGVTIGQLKPLFVMLFGPEPYSE